MAVAGPVQPVQATHGATIYYIREEYVAVYNVNSSTT